MNSGNVNVGIEGRNSSRVLKPPGGGHTDIFGSSADADGARFARNNKKSSISECFTYDNGPKIIKETQPKQVLVKEVCVTDDGCKDDLKNGNAVEDENTKPMEKVAPFPTKVRVPPGGFSSGFW